MIFEKWVMQVTNDENELPLTPPMRQRELAAHLGITEGAISHSLARHKSNYYKKYNKKCRRFVALEFDEDDDNA